MNLDIFSSECDVDPYPLYAYLRQHHPVFFNVSSTSYLVTRFDDVERGFRSGELSSESYAWQTEPMLGDRTILTMEGREHSSHRALVTPTFRGATLIGRYGPILKAEMRTLIDRFRKEGTVDLVSQYCVEFPIAVIVAMLGLPNEDLVRFEGWNQAILDYLGNVSGDEAVAAKSMTAKECMDEYLFPIIANRTQHPGDDLLSALCVSEIDGVRMTPSEIKAFIALLLVAGGETTGKTLANLFVNLLNYPQLMREVRENRKLVGAAIAETLRYCPPGQLIVRQSTGQVNFSGTVIPPDSVVMLMVGSANRDERRFAEPDVFDIHRADFDVNLAFSGAANHFGFGGGRHFCVGAALAKMEIELSVNMLLDAMNHIEADGALPPTTGLFSRAPESLPLKFEPVR